MKFCIDPQICYLTSSKILEIFVIYFGNYGEVKKQNFAENSGIFDPNFQNT